MAFRTGVRLPSPPPAYARAVARQLGRRLVPRRRETKAGCSKRPRDSGSASQLCHEKTFAPMISFIRQTLLSAVARQLGRRLVPRRDSGSASQLCHEKTFAPMISFIRQTLLSAVARQLGRRLVRPRDSGSASQLCHEKNSVHSASQLC